MNQTVNLRIPGPTPLRPEVRDAIARPMINHRSPAMASLLGGIRKKLSQYLETETDVLLLAGSGTAGLEAAIANTLSAGDPVLAVCGGVFGERFASIADAYGVELDRLEVSWGEACRPEALERALASADYRAVLLTHNETSTGVKHPIESLASTVHSSSDALVLVDAISSLGGVPLDIDGLGLDLVISGSQKAWGVPPGLAFAFVGARAWKAYETARLPKFYLDLGRYRDAAERGAFPNTPATAVLFGLDVSLDLMLAEGSAAVFARHDEAASKTRLAGRRLGLTLFAEETHASPTVTALSLPENIDGTQLVRKLREEHRIEIGGGQAKLAGRIVRVGHLGWIRLADIDACMESLGTVLREMGHRVER